jgi:membrane fusion protein (multidrug efflux system)
VLAGQQIGTAQVLARLATDELEAELEQTRIDIQGLEDRLRFLEGELHRLRSEAHPAAVEQARRDLARARLKLAAAAAYLDKIQLLHDRSLATQVELEEAELAHRLAAVAVEDSDQAMAQLGSRQRAELDRAIAEKRSLESEMTEHQARLGELTRRLDASTIVAEHSGVVTGDQLHELAGRTVAQGDELLRLVTKMPVYFEGELSDAGRHKVKPGLAVKIRLDGYPWLLHGTLNGRVTQVADRRNLDGGFTVEITLDQATAPGPIFDGMAGQARIITEEKVALWQLLAEKLLGKR